MNFIMFAIRPQQIFKSNMSNLRLFSEPFFSGGFQSEKSTYIILTLNSASAILKTFKPQYPLMAPPILLRKTDCVCQAQEVPHFIFQQFGLIIWLLIIHHSTKFPSVSTSQASCLLPVAWSLFTIFLFIHSSSVQSILKWWSVPRGLWRRNTHNSHFQTHSILKHWKKALLSKKSHYWRNQ